MSEERPQRTFDKLTNIDEYTRETRDALKELNISTTEIVSALNSIALAIDAQPGDLPHISEKFDTTFPSSGEYEFPSGRTSIDLKTGVVKFPDSDDIEYMSHTFQDTIGRSIEIKTEKEISIVLYDRDRVELSTAVFPKLYRKTNLEFTAIEITTSSLTNIWITVSSEPDGVPELTLATFKEGNPYITHGTIAAAGAADTVDVRTNLGRNAHDGYITNEGVGVGVLYVYFNSGTGYTADYVTINPFGVFNIRDEDISLLQLDTDVNGTQYRIFLS